MKTQQRNQFLMRESSSTDEARSSLTRSFARPKSPATTPIRRRRHHQNVVKMQVVGLTESDLAVSCKENVGALPKTQQQRNRLRDACNKTRAYKHTYLKISMKDAVRVKIV